MTRSELAGWIVELGAGIRRCVVQVGRLVVSPDVHVTSVIARAADSARRRHAVVSAAQSPLRTER